MHTPVGVTDCRGNRPRLSILSDPGHTKALKIARGLNEERPFDQGKDIGSVNAVLAEKEVDLVVLKSAELNLSPLGQGVVGGIFFSCRTAVALKNDKFLWSG
jgi:hypothetical protein